MAEIKKVNQNDLIESEFSASLGSHEVLEYLKKVEKVTGFSIWQIDLIKSISIFSPHFLEVFGFEPDMPKLLNDFEFPFVIGEDKKKLKRVIKSAIQKEKEFHLQIKIANPQRKIFCIEVKGEFHNRENERAIFMIVRDISQIISSKSLEITEHFSLQTIINSSPDLIWSVDNNLNLIHANKTFYKLLKNTVDWDIRPGAFILDNRIYSASSLEFWKKKYQEGLSGKTVKVEYQVEHNLDYPPTYFETVINPIFAEGIIVGLACHSRDITEKIKRNKEIQELNQRMVTAQEIAKVGYWETNLETKEVYWSKEMFKIWELEESDQPLELNYFLKSIHPEDKKHFQEKRKEALEKRKKLDVIYRIQLYNGRSKYIREIGEIVMMHGQTKEVFKGVVQDISELIETQNTLKERNTFIESTLNNLPLGIAVNKISTGEATYINQAFSDIYGWPSSQLKSVDSFFKKIYPNPEYRAWIKNQILEDIKSGDPEKMTWKGVLITTQDGEEKVVNAKNIPVPGLDLMISTVADDTERYWAEHALKISNDRFSLVSEAVSDAIWDWDLVKNTIFWGRGYHSLFGYPENQIQVEVEAWKESVHPDDFLDIWESIVKARKDPNQKYWEGKYRFRKYDGSYAYVFEKTIILRDKAGKPVRMVGALQDITKEKEREEHLKLLESVVTYTSDAILISHCNEEKKDFEIIYCNPSFTEITGYAKEEVLGRNPKFLQGIDTDPASIKSIDEALANKTSLSIELINYRKNETPFWISLILIPVKNHAGEVNHWIWIKRDISEQKNKESELKIANERFRLAADASNDAIWDWDIQKDIHFWGDGFSKLFGIHIKSQEETYQEWMNRVHPEDLKGILSYLADLQNHSEITRFELEYRFLKADGDYTDVLDTGAVLRDERGQMTRLVGAMQDISARKKYENSLKQLNEELKKTNRELELSNQELERFAYVASHDLQEPLRMISSFLGLLEKRYETLLDEKGKQYIHFAIEGAKRMRHIILDILEFSKLDNFQETKAWIETSELVHIAQLFLKKTLQQNKANFHLDQLPRIFGNKNTLIQLFQNLISNAVKYQPTGQTAEIWIECEEDNDFWKFSIRDNGLGIDDEYLEKIFIIFQRLHTQDKISGTGIGLSICKKIVELHQGEIWATSTPGQGSTFFFTIKKPMDS